MHPITDPQLAAGLAAFEEAVPGGLTLDDIPARRLFLRRTHCSNGGSGAGHPRGHEHGLPCSRAQMARPT